MMQPYKIIKTIYLRNKLKHVSIQKLCEMSVLSKRYRQYYIATQQNQRERGLEAQHTTVSEEIRMTVPVTRTWKTKFTQNYYINFVSRIL